MRKLFIICLLSMITILTGCSNLQESNKIKDTDQALTQSQIEEIIKATNDSLIPEMDLSQVTKPDPVQQAESNEIMRQLGEKYKGKATIENTNIVVARINGEIVTATDWYFERIRVNERVPSNKEIFEDLIEDKVIISEARNLGLYPPEDQIEAYIADQRKYMEIEEIAVLLKAWDISEEEYFLLMRDRFTNSLAKANWNTYFEKYGDLQEDEQGYIEKSPLWIDDDKINSLIEEVKVEVTSEGRQLGISY
ncbi:MAG: hypothetical protein ABFD18_03340 [Syntrophomonas sp.]